MSGILKLRDKDGAFFDIPVITGKDGKSAYELAVEGGYQGTEEDFIAFLNGLTGAALSEASLNEEEANDHYENFNNPHNVTAQQTGAIPQTYAASDDLNTELQQGGNKMTICNYHSGTLNTPYSEGLTVYAHGMVITNANSETYGTQMCLPSGEDAIYVRRKNGQGISQWVKMSDAEWRNNMYHEVYNNIKPSLANCVRTAIGSYTGTNTYGTKNPCTLIFDFVPLFVIVSKRGTSNIQSGGTFIWINPGTTLNFINNGSTYWCYPTLEGTTFSWYNTESAAYQLNSSSYDYDYIAWGLAV